MSLIDSGRGLYFIAIIPERKVSEEIQQVKQEVFEKYGCKASLNAPPHITLHMPFDSKETKEAILLEKLHLFSNSIEPCKIKLQNFGCFAQRAIFINVEKNEELNETQKRLFRFCKKELNLFNAQYKKLPFHPHITIAFRDLKKSNFAEAWSEFRSRVYQATFELDNLTLLKHNGRMWEMLKQFRAVN